ncbi:DUF3011 domain-containing protein [Lysobacter hankyongensis]|uniref:DUF3011 domain-containing protein n=1 Tax=Lysobacter hankyongensis TaxID=1176535 RepID=A0ABP9BDU7_9GAMM
MERQSPLLSRTLLSRAPSSQARPRGFAATLLLFALGGGIALMPALGMAQAAPGGVETKAYAPERLWELPVEDQRRVIGLEYGEQSDGRTIPDDQMRFYLDQVRFSRWTFSQIRTDIAQSLAGNGLSDPASPHTLRCESTDGRQKTCRPTWQGMSKLVRQLSNTACIQGQTWSSTPGQIWVSGGCRAEFTEEIDTTAGGIRCESQEGRSQTCPVPWRGTAKLIRQLSGTRCVAGQNWSSGNGQVRVSGGCRGLFVASGDGPIGSGEIRCESTDGKYKECGSNLYGTPELVSQLSGTNCTLDRNFGLRNGKLWVNLGCRGIFSVKDGSTEGYRVTCESYNGKYNECKWDHTRGPPRLLQKLSRRPCFQGSSWGYNRRGNLWVNTGCSAVFAPNNR